MPAERFLDTSILFYGYDLDAPTKRAAAQSLIEQTCIQLNTSKKKHACSGWVVDSAFWTLTIHR